MRFCSQFCQSGRVPKLWIASHAALLACTSACTSGREKLMRTADMKRRGSMIRAVSWLRSPCPHITRYEAQITTSVRAPSATSCTVGSNVWIVELVVKSCPVSKSVVWSMKPPQTLSRRPRLSSSRALTTRFGWANGNSAFAIPVSWTMRFWRSPRTRPGSISGSWAPTW